MGDNSGTGSLDIDDYVFEKCYTCGAEMTEGHNHDGDGWSKRHYDIVAKHEKMIKEGKQGKVIDI